VNFPNGTIPIVVIIIIIIIINLLEAEWCMEHQQDISIYVGPFLAVSFAFSLGLGPEAFLHSSSSWWDGLSSFYPLVSI